MICYPAQTATELVDQFSAAACLRRRCRAGGCPHRGKYVHVGVDTHRLCIDAGRLFAAEVSHALRIAPAEDAGTAICVLTSLVSHAAGIYPSRQSVHCSCRIVPDTGNQAAQLHAPLISD